jgi:DNA polymerase III subunit gamma/tau
MAGQHMDVVEMDAASHTGIDGIRDIIESVRYAPVEARYKVYVLDEVHMLSNQAFNALLKTLEEPPPHAKFIFATTEIRKVPVTILSRCQRFDLRRVEPEILVEHLARIADREGMKIEQDALALIARAAEGSVRDGLSLLDQALVQGDRGETVKTEVVRDMLGLADRSQTIALFESIMAGRTPEALELFRTLYGYGADPVQITNDLLEHCHAASVAKMLGPQATRLPNDQAQKLTALGAVISAGTLARVWQMLLRALDEVRRFASDIQHEVDVRRLLEKTSTLLSDITQFVGLVMVPITEQRALRQVEFLPLNDSQVLAILVVNEREVQNRIIRTPRRYSPSELTEAANYLNSAFAGKDVRAVKRDLLADMSATRDEMNRMMQTVIEMAGQLFSDEQTGKDYVVAGQTNLMGLTELSDLDKLRALFDAFNRKRDVLHLLDQALNANGVQIFIGEESGYRAFDGCSIVTSTYGPVGETMGVLGVVGPTRMPYERVIPIVDLTAKMLGSALNSL